MTADPAQTAAGESLQLAPKRVVADLALARLHHWGTREYGEILSLQQRLHALRKGDAIPDTWLAGEHPVVITQGVRGAPDDLIAASGEQIPIFQIDRGGQTTLHNPGQLVIYPIVKTQPGMLAQARASKLLLLTVRAWLTELFGVYLTAPRGRPGLFFDGGKVAAIGLSIHGRVAMHGIAINCCNALEPWRAIIPCGEPDTRPQTLSALLGRNVQTDELVAALPRLLTEHWHYSGIEAIADEAQLTMQ